MSVEKSDVGRLQRDLVGFIRAFGLLSANRTPCGQPMAASDAHAMTEIAAGSVSQRELVDRLRLDRSSVSRLVDRLVRRGWVERCAGDDRRAVRLAATDAGREVATRILGSREQRFAALLDAVPPEHRDGVLDALKLLTDAAQITDGRNHGH